ncbi:MAG: NAD(P)H-dependent oxidoreductase [Halobacteriovoraceae bacterium]|nr:NAD(P)H-dependent oxidoreductase [Halobacteriovoraceae bacterium]
MSELIIEKLNWRYATKVFDPSKKLTDTQLNTVLDSLRLSASSFGLQPWKFLVITNEEIRSKLRPASWNQSQITDASHLIVLCHPLDLSDEDVDRFVHSTAMLRNQDEQELKGYSDMMKNFLKGMSPERKNAWMKNQVYLALGNLLTVCAINDIDACPVEGFSPEKYDEILGLDKKGLKSVVVCPIGFRSNSDKYATAPKVRYSLEEVVDYI